MLRVVEPTRVCARCGERKPYSAFSARTRWPDGTVRTTIAYCRPCANAKRKAHYRDNPGSKAASCRRYRERLAQDPERLADYQEKQRIYNRVWRLRRGGSPGKYTRIGAGPMVDAAPFAAFLRSLGTSSTAIGRICGLDEAYVRKVLKGTRPVVELDTVDRALLRADVVVDGLPVTLESLYPLDEAA